MVTLVYFQYTNVLTIFVTSRKKGPKPKWTIYKHESDKNKKNLSVGYLGILSVVVCCGPIAYTSLCRDLKYLLNITHFILDYHKVDGFLIF